MTDFKISSRAPNRVESCRAGGRKDWKSWKLDHQATTQSAGCLRSAPVLS